MNLIDNIIDKKILLTEKAFVDIKKHLNKIILNSYEDFYFKEIFFLKKNIAIAVIRPTSRIDDYLFLFVKKNDIWLTVDFKINQYELNHTKYYEIYGERYVLNLEMNDMEEEVLAKEVFKYLIIKFINYNSSILEEIKFIIKHSFFSYKEILQTIEDNERKIKRKEKLEKILFPWKTIVNIHITLINKFVYLISKHILKIEEY